MRRTDDSGIIQRYLQYSHRPLYEILSHGHRSITLNNRIRKTAVNITRICKIKKINKITSFSFLERIYYIR